MGFWAKRRGRLLVVPVLTIGLLVLAGALVAYADSTTTQSPMSVVDQAQGDETPTATLVVPSADEADPEPAVMGITVTPTLTSTATITPSPTKIPTPLPATDVIVNGGFEDGFVEGQGVAVGWGRFQTGDVRAGWYDDTWFKVVYEGEHAQLLELINSTAPDRYVGIFQTVTVVPNAKYVLTLHGLVRSDEGSIEASNYGYRMHYGVDLSGGDNWESSDITWVELPWDEQPREDPTGQNVYRMETYTATIETNTDKLTLFIRGLKKWPDLREGNYDIDGVSLVGPGGAAPPATPEPGMPETGEGFAFLENTVLVVASAALLVLLVGGAVWGMSRRRA